MSRTQRKRQTFLKSINILLCEHKGKTLDKKYFLKLVNETISTFKGNHQKICNTTQLGSYLKSIPNITIKEKHYQIN